MNKETNSKKSRNSNYYFQGIERFIHEPSRLQIMNYLYSVNQADMLFLKNELKLTWGNLSSHISKLEEMKYLVITKKFVDKKPYTMLEITPLGKKHFEKYKKHLFKFLS